MNSSCMDIISDIIPQLMLFRCSLTVIVHVLHITHSAAGHVSHSKLLTLQLVWLAGSLHGGLNPLFWYDKGPDMKDAISEPNENNSLLL